MAESSECVFCEIVDGSRPCARVASNEHCLAFMDGRPIRPGHTLVIPRNHYPDLFDLDRADYLECMAMARRVVQALQIRFSPIRVGLVVAGFEVPHAHVHVIPMHDYHDISSKRVLEGEVSSATPEELARDAEEVRSALADD